MNEMPTGNEIKPNRRLGNLRPAWKPGQAPKSPGRPRLSPEIKADRRDAREILKAAAPRMAQRIVELCESSEDDTAIKALRVGLDKVLPDLQEGVMQIEHTELEPLTDEQLEKRLALARSIVSGTGATEHNGSGNGKADPS